MVKKSTLKVMENGGRGEARTEALLLERFWVLRRSVDIDGADFLIQLNDPSVRFTDPLPPRLGVVQSKFSQDEATTHYVPATYVLDAETQEPLIGFFLLIHVGSASQNVRYLLSSDEIHKYLPRSKSKSALGDFVVGKMAYEKRFRVASDEAVLDHIETVISGRSESDRRRLLHSVRIPDYPLQRRKLQNHWLIPIPNEHAFIPDEIYKIKHSLKAALYATDNVLAKIGDVLVEQDAERCIAILDEIALSPEVIQRDGRYFLQPHEDQLNLGNIGLREAIETHKRRLQMLVDRKGLIDLFIDFHNELAPKCWQIFEPLQPKFVPDGGGTLVFESYKCEIQVDLDPLSNKPARIEIAIDPELYETPSVGKIRVQGKLFSRFDDGRLAAVRDMHRLIILTLSEYYRILVSDDVVGNIKLPVLMME